MLLPDVNVWLALAFESHHHHRVAASWFRRSSPRACFFCRMTQQGFLRLASNPAAFGDEALTLDQCWACYDAFAADPRIDLADEPPGLDRHWRIFCSGKRFSPKVCNDAYLAAFAISSDCRLVTFDGGFSSYPGLAPLILD